MSTSRVELKNRWLAALLAFLIPGAGHFYQGRLFKGTIYSVCILATFFWGMHLGQWQVVYFRWELGHRTIGYLSQFFMGIPALPALVQSWRYEAQPKTANFEAEWGERAEELGETISAPFSGRFVNSGSGSPFPDGLVVGQIEMTPVPGDFGIESRGTFRGTLNGNTTIELQLSGPIEIGPRLCAAEGIPQKLIQPDAEFAPPRVYSRDQRYLKCDVVDTESRFRTSAGTLEGTIPRSFWNWFEVPLDDGAREDLHRRLGKFVEMAQIFTWIAGLLNLLAIWDALEGPAYGYGDEREPSGGDEDDEPRGDQSPDKSEPPADKVGSTPHSVALSDSETPPGSAS